MGRFCKSLIGAMRSCPIKQSLWEITDETAAEVEMGEFLYGFVRMLKPRLVVETGTYNGHSTKMLARAVHDNQFGFVFTCDPYQDDPFDPIAYESMWIAFKKCPSLYLPQLREAD